jgi:hypothetical protein
MILPGNAESLTNMMCHAGTGDRLTKGFTQYIFKLILLVVAIEQPVQEPLIFNANALGNVQAHKKPDTIIQEGLLVHYS